MSCACSFGVIRFGMPREIFPLLSISVLQKENWPFGLANPKGGGEQPRTGTHILRAHAQIERKLSVNHPRGKPGRAIPNPRQATFLILNRGPIEVATQKRVTAEGGPPYAA